MAQYRITFEFFFSQNAENKSYSEFYAESDFLLLFFSKELAEKSYSSFNLRLDFQCFGQVPRQSKQTRVLAPRAVVMEVAMALPKQAMIKKS